MTTQLYIRIRGRVTGPLSGDEIRSMVQRGRISRSHELSTDGVQWRQAGEFPELFESPVQEPQPEPQAHPQQNPDMGSGEYGMTQPVPGPAQPDNAAEWYYSLDDNPVGPMAKSMIVSLLQSGTIAPDTSVWTEKMGDWMPASSVPELMTVLQRGPSIKVDVNVAGEQTGNRKGASDVDALCRERLRAPMVSIGRWCMFISIIGLIYVTIVIGGGIAMCLADKGQLGISSIFGGVLLAVPFAFLLRYSLLIGTFREEPTFSNLVNAEKMQLLFWRAAGTYLAFVLAMILLLFILAYAGVMSLADF